MIMKTLIILLLGVVLIFAGCSKMDDLQDENSKDIQLKSADSRTINFEMTELDPTWEYGDLALQCGGEIVDWLEEDVPGKGIIVHTTAHIIDGKFVWAILHCRGTMTSKTTGEKFRILDQTRVTFNYDETSGNYDITSNHYHVHAVGDRGTHIINFIVLDYEAQTFVLTKSVCPGDEN